MPSTSTSTADAAALAALPNSSPEQDQRTRMMRSMVAALAALEAARARARPLSGPARAAAAERLFEATAMLEEAVTRMDRGATDMETRRRIGMAALLAEAVGRKPL